MADKWLDEHITKELENAKKTLGNLDSRMQLQEIIKEGFINTGKTAGYLQIYELDDERIFYDKYKDRIAVRFDLRDLMTKI
jgi:hypothetical protein